MQSPEHTCIQRYKGQNIEKSSDQNLPTDLKHMGIVSQMWLLQLCNILPVLLPNKRLMITPRRNKRYQQDKHCQNDLGFVMGNSIPEGRYQSRELT